MEEPRRHVVIAVAIAVHALALLILIVGVPRLVALVFPDQATADGVFAQIASPAA